jgi:hypothetical protein
VAPVRWTNATDQQRASSICYSIRLYQDNDAGVKCQCDRVDGKTGWNAAAVELHEKRKRGVVTKGYDV